MGIVYKAYDPDLDRQIAIKLLRAEPEPGSSEGRHRQRLLREAQALAQLSHANVVSVFDVGMLAQEVFVAMELIEGMSFRQWKESTHPSWKRTLSVLCAAGQGLASAHRNGIIHRDVKPENLVVDQKGQIKVVDFGLARMVEYEKDPLDAAVDTAPGSPGLATEGGGHDAEPQDISALHTPLTQAGAILGTPAYMSPEQLLGRPTDARSDQYSFCVVLFEALFDRLPFEGSTLWKLKTAKLAQKLSPLPRRAPIPAFVRRAILRGLSLAPEQRYPSMEALLVALSDDPRRRLGKALLAVIILAAFAVLAGSQLLIRSGSQPCAGVSNMLRDVWDPEVRKRVGQAFASSGHPYASGTFGWVSGALDRYAGEWISVRTSICEATLVKRLQTESMMNLKIACLSTRLKQLAELTHGLLSPGKGGIEAAVKATAALDPIKGCTDERILLSRVTPPADPIAGAVQEIRERVAEAKIKIGLSRLEESRLLLAELSRRARALGYPPLRAELGYHQGLLFNALGQYEKSGEALEGAFLESVAAGHVEISVRATSRMAYVLGYERALVEEGLRWSKISRAFLDWLKGSPELEVEWHNSMGAISFGKNDFEGAREHYQKMLAIQSRELGSAHPDLALTRSNLGAALLKQDKIDEAIAELLKSLAIQERVFGTEHPELAFNLIPLGNAYLALQELEQAKAYYLRALTIQERALGPAHPELASCLNNLGELSLARGAPREAEGYLQRALSIWEQSLGREHPLVAYATTGLGEASLALGRPERAQELLQRARTICKQQTCDEDLLPRLDFAWARLLLEKGERAEARALAERAREVLSSKRVRYSRELRDVEIWLQENGR